MFGIQLNEQEMRDTQVVCKQMGINRKALVNPPIFSGDYPVKVDFDPFLKTPRLQFVLAAVFYH